MATGRVLKLKNAVSGIAAGSLVYAGAGGSTGDVAAAVPASSDLADSGVTYSVNSLRAAPSGFSTVNLTWANTDPTSAVTQTQITRDGAVVATLGPVTSWADTSVQAGKPYTYGVRTLSASNAASERMYDYTRVGAAVPGPYSVSGTKIVDPTGAQFIPFGGNVGVNQGIGGNNWSDELTSPHIKEALDWGWNTIRLTVYCSREIDWIGTDATFVPNKAYTIYDAIGYNGRRYKPVANFTSGASFNASDWTDKGAGSCYGRQKAIDDSFATAQKYIDAGLVVVLTFMDVTQGVMTQGNVKFDDIADAIVQAGNRFKGESRLWVNINEPIGPSSPATFQTWHGRYYDALRGTGANNIIVADIMTNAQDAPWGTYKPDGVTVAPMPKVFDASVGPAFLANAGGTPRTNVVFGYHCYGGLSQSYDTQTQFDNTYNSYFSNCQNAGLCVGLFETGYKLGAVELPDSGTGDNNRNIRGYRACLKIARSKGIGCVVWDATFDIFTVKNTTDSSGYHGQGYWYGGGAWADLSPMGLEFWNTVNPAYPAPTKAPVLSAGSSLVTSQDLTWNRVSTATSYELAYKATEDTTWTTFSSSLTKLTASITGLTQDTSYDYRIRAVASGGAGPWCSVLTRKTNAVNGPRPTAPSTTVQPSFWLRGDQITASSSTLISWADAANGLAYAVPSGRSAPTYSATGLRGKPAATFTKAATAGLFYPKPLKAETQTILLVFAVGALGTAQGLIQATDAAAAAASLNVSAYFHGSNVVTAGVQGNTGTNAFSSTALAAAGAGIGRFTYGAGGGVGTNSVKALASSLNGGAPGTSNTQAFTAATSAGLTLAGAGTTGADVTIAEVIVFDAALSASDAAAWTQYLGQVYDLSVGSN